MSALAALQAQAIAMEAAGLSWLTTRQLALLLCVAGPNRLTGPISTRDLARAIDIDPPVVCRATAALEKARLVERHANPADGRLVDIRPGPDAADMLARLETIVAAELAR